MALTWRHGAMRSEPDPVGFGQPDQSIDDYLVEPEMRPARPPVGLQAFRVVQGVMIAAIALLSLAVFWIIGMILGIF
jgi:hypothetical protein